MILPDNQRYVWTRSFVFNDSTRRSYGHSYSSFGFSCKHPPLSEVDTLRIIDLDLPKGDRTIEILKGDFYENKKTG